ncbi:MAG: sulfurtransferase TusA family protein [Candidatus Heimdallarchaeaceae archaeon]|jgi:tRNA 2-thiouridine synthesizing protein A
MENSDTIQEIEISTGRMVLKLLKLFLFSLIRLRFYVPGIPEIKVDNLYELIISDNAPLIIDTRDNSEFYGVADYGKNYGHIHLSSFKDELIVTICPGGGASLIACEIMIEAGFTNVKSLRGGMNKWYKKGYPTTTAEDPDDLIYFVEKTAEVIDGKQTLDEAFTGEIHHSLDARGLSCPKPVLKSKKILEKLEINQVLEILTTDPGSKRDIPAWAHVTGQELISQEDRDTEDFRFLVKRLK